LGNRILKPLPANEYGKRLQMITLRDVARAAGVSTASASRVLSGGGNVSASLQLRIRAAAARLGYVPNLAARSLATRRSGLIGVVFDRAVDELTAEIVMACERALAGSGYGILIAFADTGTTIDGTEALLRRGAEAIIFADTVVPSEVNPTLARHGVSGIQLGEGFAPEGVIGISVGRREGIALAAQYLQSLGHRAVGVIASSSEDVRDAVQAVAGASVTLEVSAGNHAPDAGRSAMRRWLERDDPPTAVICGSDALALAALRECANHRIPVPERLSLIGFGDAAFARLSNPALTTVRVAAGDLGIRVAEMVLASLEGRSLVPVATPVKLIARESTAPMGVSSMWWPSDVPRET
jgi:LacI family transcriptional regulator